MIELYKLQNMNDKEQFAFLVNNPQYFVDEPLLFIIGISQDIQDKLSFKKYLEMQRKIAFKKKNIALFNKCNKAIVTAEELNI